MKRNWSLTLRLVGGLVIVAGLLAAAVAALFLKDLATASAWFQLVQGVVLGVIGWLFGSEGVDREMERADAEARKAQQVSNASTEGLERLARVERELASAESLLERLSEDPQIQAKIEELARAVGGRA